MRSITGIAPIFITSITLLLGCQAEISTPPTTVPIVKVPRTELPQVEHIDIPHDSVRVSISSPTPQTQEKPQAISPKPDNGIIQINETKGRQMSFQTLVAQWTNAIFSDYKKVDMDPMEAFPKYKTAQEIYFNRLRRKNPISNGFGKAVYPRVLLKAYRFADEKALTKEVEAWLNEFEGSNGKLKLGQGGVNLKSPPLLCAIVQRDFFVVQSACVYEGKEWSEMEKLFQETMMDTGADYIFKIGCKAGDLSYQLQP